MKEVKRSGPNPLKVVLIVANVAALIGLAVFGGFYFWRFRQVMQDPARYIDIKKYTPTADEENKRLLDEIGTLITLPQGETPIISTIKDVDSLKKDAFFENAANGDRLIIYQTAKQAVLYRESERKIIKAGPVVLPNAAKKKVSIIGEAQEAGSIEQRLKQTFADDAEVAGKTEPAGTHDSLVVVDVAGGNADLAKRLAAELNGAVAEALPEGETKPAGTDIVIIAATLEP